MVVKDAETSCQLFTFLATKRPHVTQPPEPKMLEARRMAGWTHSEFHEWEDTAGLAPHEQNAVMTAMRRWLNRIHETQ